MNHFNQRNDMKCIPLSCALLLSSIVLRAGLEQKLSDAVQVAQSLHHYSVMNQINQQSTAGSSAQSSGGPSQKGGGSEIGKMPASSKTMVDPRSILLLPNVYNIPLGIQNQCSNGDTGCQFVGTFNPVNANNGPVYTAQNGKPISCSEKLEFLNIGFTDINGANFYTIIFTANDLVNANMLKFIAPGGPGIYIAMNLVQIRGNNYIQVLLRSATNNAILAQAVSSPISGDIVTANIGFNMQDTLVRPGKNQKRLNGIKLALGQRIWYQQLNQSQSPVAPVVPSPVTPVAPTPITPSTSTSTIYKLYPKDMTCLYPKGCNFTGQFKTINNGSVGAIYNTASPFSCASGLANIQVILTDDAGYADPATSTNMYSFTFDTNVLQQPNIASLLQNGSAGICIAINMIDEHFATEKIQDGVAGAEENISENLLHSAESGVTGILSDVLHPQSMTDVSAAKIQGSMQEAQVLLTDQTGNILAVGTALMSGAVTYAKIIFTGSTTADQTYFNGFEIASGQRVWYRQSNVTTTSVESMSNITFVPAKPGIYQVPAGNMGCSDGVCNFVGNFTPVNATNGPVYSAQQGSGISIQEGLKFINVGLTDSNQKYFYSVLFDATALGQPNIASLLQKGAAGIYLAINLIQNKSENFAQVLLTDQAGNILAQATTAPLGGGITYANIGFNKNDTLTALKANQTVVNNFPIAQGARIWYQQRDHTVNLTMVSNSVAPVPVSAPITSYSGEFWA